MRIITLHCDYIKFKATKKALKDPGEEAPKTETEIKEPLVVLTAIEKGDTESELQQLIQAVKKTSELIPMCHPLLINGVDIDINVVDDTHIEILCTVSIEGKTGVEMEALTGASVTALTIYDMCKSISQEMIIKENQLLQSEFEKNISPFWSI